MTGSKTFWKVRNQDQFTVKKGLFPPVSWLLGPDPYCQCGFGSKRAKPMRIRNTSLHIIHITNRFILDWIQNRMDSAQKLDIWKNYFQKFVRTLSNGACWMPVPSEYRHTSPCTKLFLRKKISLEKFRIRKKPGRGTNSYNIFCLLFDYNRNS